MNTLPIHRPKGGMCAVCTQATANCSALPFARMPVIAAGDREIIVRCTEFKRATLIPPERRDAHR